MPGYGWLVLGLLIGNTFGMALAALLMFRKRQFSTGKGSDGEDVLEDR